MRNGVKILGSLIGNNLPLLIFSLIFYTIIIFLSGYLNIWEDEVYSLNTSSGNLQYAFHQSIFFEAQPPVYFLVLTLWRLISVSILWARMLNLVLILISQILLYQFVNKVTNRKIAIISSVLFLLNPTTIFTLLEIRLFALIILLSLTAIIFFYNTYYIGELRSGRRILFILIAIAGLFTQYYFGFLLFSCCAVLFLEKKKRSFWLYLFDMIIPSCLLLFFIPHVLQNVKVHNATIPLDYKTFWDSLTESIRIFFERTLQYIIPLNFSTVKIWIFRGVIITLLFISFNYAVIKKEIRSIFPFIIISLVVYVFFIVVHCMFGIHYSAYKYTTVVFIPLFISAILLFKFLKPGLFYYAFILLIGLYVTFNFKRYHELYKINDYKSIGVYLEKDEKEGEPIFVFRNISKDILEYYYKGVNKLMPIPRSFAYDKEFGPDQWDINKHDIKEMNEKLNKCSSFYILIDDSPIKGYAESKKILMDFLLNHFKLKDEKSFKETITLYRFYYKTDPGNNLVIK